MGFSYLGYVLPGHTIIIVIGKFIFPEQYDQEKCNLHKCIILSQTKTIEKVMFKFLFFEKLFTYLFYLNFLKPSSLSKVIWYKFMPRLI